MKKYLICPGMVTSKRDGDKHYITADQLIRLYKVNPSECVVMPKNNKGYRPDDELIVLSPDYSGQYIIPQKNKNRLTANRQY
jgi:hypothetical protein